jgi:tetratricopeptide (TPR) repeat protein
MSIFRMKQNGSLYATFIGLLLFLTLNQFSIIGMPSAMSQNEASGANASANSARNAALNADINFRRRELEADPNNAQARAQLATALERKKDYEGMVEVLAEHKDKVGRAGLLLLARAYMKLQRSNEEIAVLELANARYPKDAGLQTQLASALSRSGKRDASIEAYYKAREMNAKFIPAYEGLLSELVRAESRQEARDLLSDMMKRFGQKGKWLSELCSLYVEDAFHEKAVETCRIAIKKDGSNPMPPVHLARTFREQEKPEEAKKVLVTAATKIRRSEPVQTALGEYFLEKKNFVDAYRWFKAGAKSDPKSYSAQIGLAQAALELQKMEDSVKAFTAACNVDRKAIREFQSALGKIRQRGDFKWQGRFEDAIANSCGLSF